MKAEDKSFEVHEVVLDRGEICTLVLANIRRRFEGCKR